MSNYSDEPALPPVLWYVGLPPDGAPPPFMTYQTFTVVGRIVTITEDDAYGYCEGVLLDDLRAYFAVMPPVKAWRAKPTVETHRDFAAGTHVVLARARGVFDVVRPGGEEWHRFDMLRDE